MATGGRRRGRVFIFIALILILLLVLAWAVTRFMSPDQLVGSNQPTVVEAPPLEEMVTIVISVQPISRGTEFTEAVVTTIPYPKKDLVEGSFITDINEVLGKRAKDDLDARTPITSTMVVDPSMKNSPAAFKIPAGQVAIAVPVSKLSSVAYGLESGDHVNVILSLLLVDIDPGFQSKLPNNVGLVVAPGPTSEGGPTTASATITKGDGIAGRTELDPTLGQPVYVIPSESQRPRLVSQTLIQDAIVLYVGNFPQPGETVLQPGDVQPTPIPGQEGEAAPVRPLPDTVSLVVSPQDAVTINYLILAGGKLNLVMRSAGDLQRTSTEPVTLQFILDQYNIPNPAKLPYGLEPRMDVIPDAVGSFPTTGGTSSTTSAQPPQ
jgi:pilus assembly protein CpaB